MTPRNPPPVVRSQTASSALAQHKVVPNWRSAFSTPLQTAPPAYVLGVRKQLTVRVRVFHRARVHSRGRCAVHFVDKGFAFEAGDHTTMTVTIKDPPDAAPGRRRHGPRPRPEGERHRVGRDGGRQRQLRREAVGPARGRGDRRSQRPDQEESQSVADAVAFDMVSQQGRKQASQVVQRIRRHLCLCQAK